MRGLSHGWSAQENDSKLKFIKKCDDSQAAMSGLTSATVDVLDTMASLSILCRVCHDALYAKRCSFEKPQNGYIYQSHHPTLDSFLNAATQKCFMCCIVYDNVNHQA
jgi:hypothetical protein